VSAPAQFPLDSDGKPLAWPDPAQPDWYIDAWNGIYDSRDFALCEAQYWVATEADRILAYGERPVDEAEAERRRGAK
jgi:hypothetical protein